MPAEGIAGPMISFEYAMKHGRDGPDILEKSFLREHERF